jgi:CheY-like chemotaxis protein
MPGMNRPASRKKILCIDDTSHVRQLVHRLLSADDYVILEADDGLRGIDLARAERPDLVLVDLHMPGLTGYEVATRIKSILPGSPVVALSADVTDHVRERALASGCDGYLSKPIDPDEFVEQVASYLSGEREFLEDNSFRQAYQQTLVARLEKNVRELTEALDRNAKLNAENLQLLAHAQRRAKLLEAGARVSPPSMPSATSSASITPASFCAGRRTYSMASSWETGRCCAPAGARRGRNWLPRDTS